MSRMHKLYKKMRHIHLRLLDNEAYCNLAEVLEWLYITIEQNEPLNSEFVRELQRIAATCEMEYRPDIERLLERL